MFIFLQPNVLFPFKKYYASEKFFGLLYFIAFHILLCIFNFAYITHITPSILLELWTNFKGTQTSTGIKKDEIKIIDHFFT